MTAPVPQFDMGRVVQRAATAAAGPIADLAVELAVTQERADLATARVAELEKQLEEKDADLARLRQSSDALRGQLAERDAATEMDAAAAEAEVQASDDQDEPTV